MDEVSDTRLVVFTIIVAEYTRIAGIPPLAIARYHESNYLCIINIKKKYHICIKVKRLSSHLI